jgi:hypothetical protein
MENQKLRAKIGEHEFEAEGPKEVVTEQFNAWKEIVLSRTANKSTPDRTDQSGVSGAGTTNGQPQTTDTEALSRIVAVDEKRQLVTLVVHPSGDQREGDAIILILYGFRLLLQQEQVGATKIAEAMRTSGMTFGRIDRDASEHITSGYMLKTGRAKGSKYRLSNTGVRRAAEITQALAAQM